MSVDSNLLGYISSAMAVIAVFISFSGYRLSKKSLALSLKEASKKEPKINIILQEGFSKNTIEDIFFMFSIAINNSADANNCIVSCDLKVTHKRKDGTCGNFYLNHQPAFSAQCDLIDKNLVELPCHIKSHGSEIGFVVFKVDANFIDTLYPVMYEIVLRDVHGIETKEEAFLIQERSSE